MNIPTGLDRFQWTQWYRKVYLYSSHWRETRKRAIEDAGGICRGCRSTARLQVHHLNYNRLGREIPADLEVLCRPCHDRVHTHEAIAAMARRAATDVHTFTQLRNAEIEVEEEWLVENRDEVDDAVDWWESHAQEWPDNVYEAAPYEVEQRELPEGTHGLLED